MCIRDRSAAACDLLLHLLKDFLGDNGFVCVLHSEPFFLRLAYLFLVLVRDVALLVVYAVADIGFVFKDALYPVSYTHLDVYKRQA